MKHIHEISAEKKVAKAQDASCDKVGDLIDTIEDKIGMDIDEPV